MFLWEKHGISWYGIYGKHVLKIFNPNPVILSAKRESDKEDNNCEIQFFSYPHFHRWERHVFRLSDNLKEIFSCFSGDILVTESINKYPGLRLMRQEPFQCMISFACASNTNILMIRRMLKNLCRKFGKRVIIDGKEFFTFPSIDHLNRASHQELRQNYRWLFNNKLESPSSRMRDGKVFEKVTAHEYRILSKNAREYFGKYCGYAQQSLFYNIRQNAGKKW